MPNQTHPRKEPYPSDLTDAEWRLLRPLLPGAPKLGRPPRYDRRLVLNAIFYVVRSGCAWRLLPHDLPPWRLVYYYFATWRESGLWPQLNDALREAVRERRGKKKPPALRSSTRRVLKWLTTPECAVTMRAKRSEGENGIWW
jgi:putative transposase